MSIRLNGIFKDNVVFQRDKEMRIFGAVQEYDGRKMVVTARLLDGKNIIATGFTDEVYPDGFFLVSMEAQSAGGPYTLEISSSMDAEKNIMKNVYIGEVWLASGQSNMEYPMGRAEGAKEELEGLIKTNIHFYNVPQFGSYTEGQIEAEDESKWIEVNKNTCYGMSGIAYYFARKVEQELLANPDFPGDLHIGIIGCYLGGSSISCWQSIDNLTRTEEGRRYIEEFEAEVSAKSDEFFLEEQAQYYQDVADYNERAEDVMLLRPHITYKDLEKAAGKFPWPPPIGRTCIRRPGSLFDTMILRIVPFALRGIILYQGEEDCDSHYSDYSVVFKTLIEEWREAFWDEELPFFFCQLPMYIDKERKYMGYDDLHWPALRNQQLEVTETVKNTHMAILADYGEFDNLHPADKRTPGERLANLALKYMYGYDKLPVVAPHPIDVRRGEGIEISFAGDFNTLNLANTYSAEESGFEIAGEDGVFVPADASVEYDGKTVVVSSAKLEFPTRVRYAYFSYGPAPLVSDTGLVAAPFEKSIDKSIGSYF